MTILVRNSEPCAACGGTSIDNKATGERAAKWRRAVNVSQKSVAVNAMGIGQSFYSALELGQRNWTPKLVNDFEAAILPLITQAKVDVTKL